MQLWSSRCRLCCKKPMVTEKFDSENRVKLIWNAFTGCLALSKFQRWDQSFWFSTPMLLYKCDVSDCNFIRHKSLFNLQLCQKISLDIKLKHFSYIFWNFRTIRILMNQLHNLVFLSCFPIKLWCFPFKIGWKNPTCNDEEVWLSGKC